MPESYDKNVSVFTFRKIIGAVNETRIRDARFSIFPPVLLPANVEPAFIFWHVEADVRRENKICEVRVRFNTSSRWLPREENFYGRRRRLSHESRRLREQRRVRVVPRSCKTRVLQFGPYATASASAALLQIEFPRLSKSGLFSALVSSSRIVSYSFSNLSSHANLPSWTSCQGSARRPYMKDSASCRPFVGWSLLYSRPDANNSRLWTTRVADVPNATYKASEMVRTRSSSSSSPC